MINQVNVEFVWEIQVTIIYVHGVLILANLVRLVYEKFAAIAVQLSSPLIGKWRLNGHFGDVEILMIHIDVHTKVLGIPLNLWFCRLDNTRGTSSTSFRPNLISVIVI